MTGIPVEEALRFPSFGAAPSGLAYDAVSGRYLFGASSDRKVIVVAEQSSRAIDLVRAESAQFLDVLAIEIDTRRGDLWVASADPEPGPGQPAAGPRAVIHKLQLISGRPLQATTVPALERPARVTDLAITSTGAVLALDSAGQRLWRLPAGANALQRVADLRVDRPSSLAVARDGRHAFVAHAGGLARIDLTSGALVGVGAAPGVDLGGIERLRAGDGVLVAVQRAADATPRVMRLRLARGGGRVESADVIDASLPAGSGTPAVAIVGRDFYYVVLADAAPDAGTTPSTTATATTVVRRLRFE
jgi:hypothetical protein